MTSYYEALISGLPVYDEGAECKQRHPKSRYVKTNQCVYCSKESKKRSAHKIKMKKIEKDIQNNPYVTFPLTIHIDDQRALWEFIEQLSINRRVTEAGL